MAAALISARIDRLPGTRHIWFLVGRVSFGAFFEIYEIALTTVLGPALVAAGIFHAGRGGLFGLPDLASFAFVTFAGLFVGALAFSSAADKFGRRPIFTYSLIWYAIATIVMGLQNSAGTICLWRFIAAIGVGAEVVAVDSYLSELTPKAVRGRAFALSKFFQYTAIPVAGLLSVTVLKHGLGGIAGWRVLALFPVIGAAAIWLVRLGLPESPRWLAEHGRPAEADRIVTRLEASTVAATGQPLRELEPPICPIPEQGRGLSLWSPALRRRVAVIIVASSTGTIAYFGFGNWLPSLLEAQGVTVTKSLIYTAATLLVQPLAPLLILLFADRFERKSQIIAGALLSALFGLIFTRQTGAFGWITCGVLITAANNLLAGSMHTYRSELFPTAIRGRAIGFVYSIDRLVAAFNSYLVGFVLVTFQVTGVFIFLALALLVCCVTIGLFGPRTTGRSADEADEFGVTT